MARCCKKVKNNNLKLKASDLKIYTCVFWEQQAVASKDEAGARVGLEAMMS